MIVSSKSDVLYILFLNVITIGPVDSKHGNLRPPLNSGSMALGSTTCRQRHGVGKRGERTRGAGDTGNGHGTEMVEAGESGGGK